MRRFLTVVGALILTALTVPVWAADQIEMKGSVALSCSVTVTDLGQDINLRTGEFQKVLGSVVENCNSPNGYTITLTSANNGNIKSEYSTIRYGFFYDDKLNYLTSPASFLRSSANFNKKTDVKLDVSRSDNYIAGSYTDTVIISIAAR